MNLKLKAKIIEKFGSQFNFSQAVKQHEAFISKVVRNHRKLSEDEKTQWAAILETAVEELFG